MKALLRWGIGLFGLFSAVSVSFGYDWVSPVTKCPLGFAPNIQTAPQYYFYGWDGRLYGPYWYLVPPFPPQQGFLPGPIGRAIMSGYLPHELLMNKEAMTIGDMPLLGKKKEEAEPPPMPPGMGGMSPGGMPPMGMGGMPPMGMGAMPPNTMGMGAMPPNTMGMGAMPPLPYMQMPLMPNPSMPPSPYLQMPRPGMPPGMPQPSAPTPGAPYAVPYQQPLAPRPTAASYGGMVPYTFAVRDPATGIWQVQSVAPLQPGFTPPPPQPLPMPPRPGMPMMPPPGMPMMPPGGPMMPVAPPPMTPPGFYFLNPGYQTAQPPMPPQPSYDSLNVPRPPRPEYQPMDLPRMDTGAPPVPQQPCAFPTHPLIRSPRDFFMWSEKMQDEKARGNRPYPVP